jgi:hypothetical protein
MPEMASVVKSRPPRIEPFTAFTPPHLPVEWLRRLPASGTSRAALPPPQRKWKPFARLGMPVTLRAAARIGLFLASAQCSHVARPDCGPLPMAGDCPQLKNRLKGILGQIELPRRPFPFPSTISFPKRVFGVTTPDA